MPPCLQRKYIDLIRQVSSKWVNWDPPIEIQVGAYGTIDKETGDLLVEGNIYDPAFQQELDKHGVKINLANFPPREGPVEDDFIIASRGVKRGNLNVNRELDVAGVANASAKGEWVFEQGRRGAILIMHRPRQIFLPPNALLEALYKVDKLINKWLVTSIHVCPAYSMYLSDKSGDKLSLALVAQAPIANLAGVPAGANDGFAWQVDVQSGLLRKACDQTGNYSFTPLFSLKRPIRRIRRFIRDTVRPEPSGDELWDDDCPPWDPLDEDGEEDLLDPDVTAVDPFAAAEQRAAELAALQN